jgi:hypothetical protein
MQREAFGVLAIWFVAGVWTLTVSFALGYQRDPESLAYPFGLKIPDWAFWGVFVPWAICSLLTIPVCFRWIEDCPLEPEPSEGAAEGEKAA